MGEPKRLSRKYDVPRKVWDRQKIIADRKLIKEYGLRNKEEIWKAETQVRNLRKLARQLLAGGVDDYTKRSTEILNKLVKMGVFTKDHTVEDILKLQATDILERRLQTQVFKKGLSLTVDQARQLITHGHIAVNGVKRTAPSSIVNINDNISYTNTKIKAVIDKSIEAKGKPVLKEEKKEEVKGE